jgi:dTMP kinase
MTGKLIVFEGGEGSGKSTQIERLKQGLDASPLWQKLCRLGEVTGIVVTREPGATALGKTLRQLLLHPQEGADMNHKTELLLYAADRAQHVEEIIRPALAKNYWVLCDRFVDSTLAYQGYGRGLSLELIQQLNQVATGGLTADLTLWLELDAAAGLGRTQRRGQTDRMEQTDLVFHQRVQAGFAALAGQHPDRIMTIPGDGSIQTVANRIQTVVDQHLQQWYPSLLTA